MEEKLLYSNSFRKLCCLLVELLHLVPHGCSCLEIENASFSSQEIWMKQPSRTGSAEKNNALETGLKIWQVYNNAFTCYVVDCAINHIHAER